MDKIKELTDKINKDFKERRILPYFDAVFGDMDECTGLIEDVLDQDLNPVKQGYKGKVFVKLYGNSYLWKGLSPKREAEGIGLAKSMISLIPREIILTDPLKILHLVFNFIFRRKRFLHDIFVWISAMYYHTINKSGFTPQQQHTFTSELRRAVETCLKREIKEDLFDHQTPNNLYRYGHIHTGREFYEIIAQGVEFIYYFLEKDNAYRFRLQDVLENLDKTNGSVKEIRRILKLLQDRESLDPNGQISNQARKWKYLRRATIILYIWKDLRIFLKNVIMEIDIDKVRLDDSDWYFCLKRSQYNFRGIPYKERLQMKESVDKLKGHIPVKFVSPDKK